ncbi:hypothetical protein HJG60_009288 [Phyllostomus discolor]|uniref:Uncharacterized protein n=1 Tax=Phyllostomus discolor TaxID=89673 RepID=A0A833YSF2_9CHIR|nr:hypothetical protein HJG60_009288 [Phyllostomus discolor]
MRNERAAFRKPPSETPSQGPPNKDTLESAGSFLKKMKFREYMCRFPVGQITKSAISKRSSVFCIFLNTRFSLNRSSEQSQGLGREDLTKVVSSVLSKLKSKNKKEERKGTAEWISQCSCPSCILLR